MASFPNLRRLFIEARSDDEEREVSRRAVSTQSQKPSPVSILSFYFFFCLPTFCYSMLPHHTNKYLPMCLFLDYKVLQRRIIHGLGSRIQSHSAEDERPQIIKNFLFFINLVTLPEQERCVCVYVCLSMCATSSTLPC
ncbi:hypothetical protein F4810DRAFT_682308 [Camillea tinctor]|nr:hypothetical protein F4810DRAFT_682308 [Camillea tinctor]